MKDIPYVLVTPVRNEEATIEKTIVSVASQTILPREWVIVSDGSDDGTDSIVARHAEAHPWLRLVRLTDRPGRNFASVVFATEQGYRSLEFKDYAFVGLLDADIRFQPDYFETLLSRFLADSHLGLAGGLVIDVVNGKLIRSRQHLQDVAGAVQFFRRECFEAIGGLVPVPEGGWDAITCVAARMKGFKTATFPDIVVEHLKPRNAAEGSPIRRQWQFGIREYALANHPLFEVAKCCGRLNERPLILGALCRLGGYCWANVTRRTRILPRPVVAFLRREQLLRIKSFLSW